VVTTTSRPDERRRSQDPLLDRARLVGRIATVTIKLCEEQGLTIAQYRSMLYLVDSPMRASELADLLAVTRPTLSAIMRGLDRRGLIVRRAVPSDGRGVELSLTRQGHAALQAVDHELVRFVTALGGQNGSDLAAALDTLHGPLDDESNAWKARQRRRRNHA
jgi:DNA-binding MarR family transcriptional regulator